MSLINSKKDLKLDVKIRDFSLEDYPAIADVNNAVFPDMPFTAEEYIEQDNNRDKKYEHRRWVAILENKIIGTGLYTQHVFQYNARKFHIWLLVMPEYQHMGVGSKLFDMVQKSLRQFDPISIKTEARSDKNNTIEFLLANQFEEFQRYSEPHLDVGSFDFKPYENLESKLNSNGIEIKTLRELANDPQRDWKIYELDQELIQDMPDEDGFTKVDFQFFKKSNIEASNTLPDAYFIAIDGDKYIGLTRLIKFGKDTSLFTGLTGVKPEYRRNGIATCLKIRAINFARLKNYANIRTGNMSGNQPMLQLNQKLGFIKKFDWICFRKYFEDK